MKTSFAAAILPIATVVLAQDCDIEQLKPLFLDSDVIVCTEDSGFSLIPSAKPSPEVLTKLCASETCRKMLMMLKSLRMGDCTLLDIRLETDLLTPASNTCARNSTSSNSSISEAGGDKASEGTGETKSVAPSVTTNDSTDFTPLGTAKTGNSNDTTTAADSQTSASSSIADSAMATTDSAKASVSSVSSDVATTTAAAVMTTALLLQLF